MMAVIVDGIHEIVSKWPNIDSPAMFRFRWVYGLVFEYIYIYTFVFDKYNIHLFLKYFFIALLLLGFRIQ